MNAALVIAVALLPFALVAIALYRTLLACVIRLGLRPMVAVLLYWAAVAILPVGILWLQVRQLQEGVHQVGVDTLIGLGIQRLLVEGVGVGDIRHGVFAHLNLV